MMRERKIALMVLVWLVILVMSPGLMAAEGGAAGPAPDAWTEFWNTFRNPSPWLQMGLDFRFRTIYAENITTLRQDTADHGNYHNFERYRTRWSTKWRLNEDVDFNTRLTWEFRTWHHPHEKRSTIGTTVYVTEDRNTNFDEALFDHFNIAWRNMFGLPVTGTVGRQDVILGRGWLVLDGTPLDGSRTIFMDAARFNFDWAEQNTKLDLIYVDNAPESKRWLKPINDQDRALMPSEERGLILYLTNNSLEKTQLDGFFMYKNDNPIDSALHNMPPHWTRKAEIFTLGGAVAGTPAERWTYRVEGAIQTGEKSDVTDDWSAGEMQDMEAYGALANLEYSFKDTWDNKVHVGGEYASGDDPDSRRNEQFDLLWAKWPRWSELYIYTYAPETMVAESTNLIRLNVGHEFKPHRNWRIATDYHALWADESGDPWNPTLELSDSNKFRGHLLTCWAHYTFGEQLKGHLLGEYLIPGNYYEKVNRDDAFWLRFNLEYTF